MSTTETVVYTAGTGQLMAMAAAWAIYAQLFITSVRIMVRKGIRGSIPRQILLFSTCVMFTASTALAIVDTAIYVVSITVEDYVPTYNGLQLSCEILFDSLFIMGDTIVLWRMWVICYQRRFLVLFPILLCFASFSCLLTLIGIAARNGRSSGWTVGVYDAKLTMSLSMATAALSASTNFFATALITYTAWRHRIFTRNLNTSSSVIRQTGVRRVMSILVESGSVYFGLWVVAMLNFYFDWHAPVLQAVLRGFYDMVIGIYPTIIIILVSMDCTCFNASPAPSSRSASGSADTTPVLDTLTPFSNSGRTTELDTTAYSVWGTLPPYLSSGGVSSEAESVIDSEKGDRLYPLTMMN